MQNSKTIVLSCFHCGNKMKDDSIILDQKAFCCSGCKMVYEILNEHNLCTFYDLNTSPGIIQNTSKRKDKFGFLENKEIQKKLIQFSNKEQSHITFYIPQIHCSSCLWLLENIYKINEGIVASRVNFTKKEVFIVFDNNKTNLREVVESLDQIGYEPHLSLNETSSNQLNNTNKSRWYKIGVAGFCFGNIMMMSLADYFVSADKIDPKIDLFLKTISIILSLPVLFYAAGEFFSSAWYGLKNKYLNIDLPVALALLITFIRSIYEITLGIGSGYLDSMSGIVFFMLIGRWFQSRTYNSISFDRDYKSFFPIALNVIQNGMVKPTEISKVKVNDIIQVHSNEIIPVDAILSKGHANIDYSFVSGESLPIHVAIGEIVYAGGKQLNGLLELIVVKEVSQSYLTNLWNNPVFNSKEKIKENTYDIISKYFTYFVLGLGVLSGLFWLAQGELSLMWNAITTVLIVACPCALLLSNNYTYGNILRVLGLNKFYLRSPLIIEKLSKINHIVFDKTGTITQSSGSNIRYSGNPLNTEMKISIASLLHQSSHPVSKIIIDYLHETTLMEVTHFKETEGKGIEGWINEKHIKIGSPSFIGIINNSEVSGTKVVVFCEGLIIGTFIITNKYRFGITKMIQSLKKNYTISLLSGDNDSELNNIKQMLGYENEIYFNQTPQQKLEYIARLQKENGLTVLMIGDGLNDAGALKQSDVGIAVADTTNNFTPSCDGVIDAKMLIHFNSFIQLARTGKNIILLTFCISVTYNIIGLFYAMQGILSPVIAAILMPCSSITIILLTYALTEAASYKLGLKKTLIFNKQ